MKASDFPCFVCGGTASQLHHRKLRSQGGTDEPENLLPVCLGCHGWIHANPAESYELGLLVHSWDDPVVVLPQPGPASAPGAPRSASPDVTEPMQTTVDGDEVPHVHVVNEQGVEKPCTKCHGTGKIVVKEKAKGEPKERATSSAIYNARTPKGHDRSILEDDEEQITDVLVKAGVLRGHEGARWWAIHYAYRFTLQNIRAFAEEFKGQGS